MGGKMSRDKGARVERELVNKLKEAGIDAKKVPLSGAVEGYKGDIALSRLGEPFAEKVSIDWIAEVKARKNGEGFKTLEGWLGENDVLFLKRNNANPIVVLTWDNFVELVK